MGKTQMIMKVKMLARGGYSISLKSFKGPCKFHRISLRYVLTVCRDINEVVRGSSTQWRGKSYAASAASSDIPSDAQRRRKRVSIDERQAMVECFVNKYRQMNAGKFPQISVARKQVGGSHYTVRKIIQELEYKSKMSRKGTLSTAAKGVELQSSFGAVKTLSEEVVESATPDCHFDFVGKPRNLLKRDAEAFPSCSEKPKDDQKEDAQQRHLPNEETEDFSDPVLEISGNLDAEVVSPSDFEEPDAHKEGKALHNDFDFVPAESHLLKEVGEIKNVSPCLESAEDNKKEEAVFEDKANFDCMQSEAGQYKGSIELDKVPE
ncbi:hypothetical protein CJ030_MR5G025793 [Morella rubra]|uniref:AT3G52170-like helix-turn-helix domain-containing protein n=1 Tax=Morella rubra TaxID=262757 RepID=A0A6A1VJ93_9ROSI|nr:hypothetical protein CJ030_MR5G025793 [Morella rubra]